MNAAELALLADPKALLAYASSVVNMILNGDVSPDGVVDTQLAAHTAHGAPAEAPAQPAAPEAEKPKLVVIDRLGTDPVVEPLTDAEKAKGMTITEKGFIDPTPADGIDNSPIMESARKVALKFGMNEKETEDFLKWVQENKQKFIDASKVDGSDGFGYKNGEFRDVMIVDGEATMGGRHGAQHVDLQFTEPQEAARGTYTMADGRKVNFDIYDKCGNPQLSNVPAPEPVKPAPIAEKPVCPPEGTTVSREPFEGGKNVPIDESVTGNERNLRIRDGEEIPVVTIKDMPTKGMAVDLNGDKNLTEPCKDSKVGVGWDEDPETGQQEIFPGITKDRIADDIKFFEEKYGHKPEYIVYDVTDCNGNNVVACWNVEEGKWGFFHPETPEGIPVDSNGDPVVRKTIRGDYRPIPGRTPALINTHDELMAFLGKKQGPIT